MKRWTLVLAAIVVAITLLAIGILVGRHSAPAPTAPAAAADAGSGGKKILYWYDPMVPAQHFDKPGLSPMGMQMVPKYAYGAGANDASVRIDPAVQQNLGLRTMKVESGRLQRDVSVPGTVGWDLRQAQTVSARASGVINQLFVRAPYESVKAGQPLAALISPQWNAAAQEYLALAGAPSADARALRGAARARLRALGMDEQQIRSLHGNTVRVLIRAPNDGVVSALDVREGQQVASGMPLMTINGLDTVWLEAALPQSQGANVAAGTPVQARVSALPGTIIRGRVESLLPDVDRTTRTQRARIVLDNPGHQLAPGMFAQVSFRGPDDSATHPLVPDEALISTGTDTRVIVADGKGRFRPIAVRPGRSANGMTEILAGLQGGEQVVVSGQFLIDSEASLSGALQRLDAGAADAAAGPMSGMAMPAPANSSSAAPGKAMEVHPDGTAEPARSMLADDPSGPMKPMDGLPIQQTPTKSASARQGAMSDMAMPAAAASAPEHAR
jgi:Cu(I)/Ag(I) efflux system membrane fusion protein